MDKIVHFKGAGARRTASPSNKSSINGGNRNCR
jgi:hypothetical protein